MIVRTATPAELAEVGELRVAAYHAGHFLDAIPTYADRLRALGEHGVVLVAVDDKELLGTIMLERWHEDSDMATGPEEAEVRALAVAPSAQGRGVGRALVRAVVDLGVEWQLQRLVLFSQPAMVAAHRLYEKAGFVRTPDRDHLSPTFSLLAYGLEL
ncbi:GNAT family N-acetyltransferase [Kutzneria chonburiensis]|uniref:GNAT family N-acetyltransferase n=1 Tax=Kutzneria chonburiensis TaxID=1483604 RepID=A0ABV6MZM4_9PSEU|nr:GNAT family N-acetyltransferase [Kutzneria chonburiensis]